MFPRYFRSLLQVVIISCGIVKGILLRTTPNDLRIQIPHANTLHLRPSPKPFVVRSPQMQIGARMVEALGCGWNPRSLLLG